MDEQALKETLLSKETVYNGSVIDVERWQVRLPNGQTAGRDVVVHGGGATIAAVDEMGRVAMVSQYRCAVERITLELPAGKLDRVGESPLVCAVRELSEETGLQAGRMIKLTDTYTTPGFCSEKLSIFLALDLTRHPSHPDTDEFLSVSFVPLDEMVQRVTRGEVEDAKTLIGLLLAQNWLANH